MSFASFVSSPAVVRIIGLIFLTSGLSSGQIPQNGSFENDYAGWTRGGNQAVATNDPSHPASNGSKVVVFSPGNTFANAWVSQSFATTPGQRYRLAVDLGTVGAIADQLLGIKLEGNELLLEETRTASSIDAGAFYTWQYLTFVANSASTNLTLYDDSSTYFVVDLLLDNVVVTPENAQAPLITSEPKNTHAVSGGSATFSATASGPGPLTYEWFFNGTNISGANASSYTVTGANGSKAGNYSVRVTNAFGSVISSAATLRVIPEAILLNGSFEYHSAAWTFHGSVAASTNVNWGVTDGAQLVHFNFGQQPSGGTLSQTFATTIGQTYALSFDAGAFSTSNQNEQRMQITVQGNGTLLSETVSVFAPGNGPRYKPLNFVFVANSSSTTLNFKDTSPTNQNVDLLLDNVRITIHNAPYITAQPESLNVTEGSTATFSVTASGQAPLSYQWRKNGTNIIGANSSSYGIPVVLNGDAGLYDVVVSNSLGSVTSSTATLTVGSDGMLINGSFEFSYGGWIATGNQAVVSGPSFQASDGSKLVAFNVGQKAPNGVLSQIFPTTIGQTYILSFDAGAISNSNQNEQRMQVRVQGNSTLVSQSVSVFAPGNGTRYLPKSFSFVADSSTPTLTFQDISTNTSSIDLLLDNVRVTAHNGPVITAQPQSLTVQTGNSATFSVTATGQAPLSYQWRRNGVPIAGATSSSYSIASAQGTDAGSFDVIVSNDSGAVTSSTAVLTVVPAGLLLNGSFEFDYSGWSPTGNQQVVSSPYQPSDGTKLVAFNAGQKIPNGVLTQTVATTIGQAYTLSFDAGAISNLNQNEQRMQVRVEGNSTLVSQSVSVFAPGNGTRYLPKSFSFVADSSTTTLTFQDISTNTSNIDLLLDNVRVTAHNGPVITAQPQSLTVQTGNSATFSVTATGQAPLSYQWRRSGVPIAGATSSSYSIASAQGTDAGSFDVIVSNDSGAVTSSTAVLTVVPAGLLLNGSFEFDYSGWSPTGNQQVVSSPYQPSDGTKLVAFNAGQKIPNGVLTQTVATTIGQTYILSFDAGAISNSNQNEQRMQVRVQGNSTLVSQSVSVFAPGNGTRYLPKSFSFVADSSTTTLTFQDISTNTSNIDLLLDNVRVTAHNGPVITAQPQSLTVQTGNSATFSVTATGQAPLSYQWRRSGVPIAGATSSSYSIASAQGTDAGSFDVIVSNDSGAVTSSTAVLTVVPAGLLLNGSFEFDYSGWSPTGNQQVVSSPYQPSDGTKLVAFNAGQKIPNGVLTQTVATTIGQAYTLSFDAGAISNLNQNEQRMQVRVQGNSTLVSQSVSVFAPGNGTRYLPKSFSFVADSSTTTLTFQDISTNTSNIDLLLDNVRVTAQSSP